MSADRGTVMLRDGRVLLRALEPEDLDVLYRWENDTRLWNVGAAVAPFSRKQLWDYIETYDGNIFTAGQLRLMIIDESDRRPVGAIDIYDFDAVNRRAFIGIMVDETFRGNGFAAGALSLVERYCRVTLGLHQLAAVVPVDNEPSRRLFSTAGFSVNGRLRSWLRSGESYRDAFFYQKLL